MINELVLIEHVNDTEYNKHVIHVPENVRGGKYQQLLSIDAFHGRILYYWYNTYRNKHKHSRLRFSRNRDTRFLEFLTLLHTIEHDSVWLFFDYIHYDHKNKSKSHYKEFINNS